MAWGVVCSCLPVQILLSVNNNDIKSHYICVYMVGAGAQRREHSLQRYHSQQVVMQEHCAISYVLKKPKNRSCFTYWQKLCIGVATQLWRENAGQNLKPLTVRCRFHEGSNQSLATTQGWAAISLCYQHAEVMYIYQERFRKRIHS